MKVIAAEGICMPTVQRYTAYFDTPAKTAATKQFMEQNCATFDQATEMLNYQQGVDFILFVDEEDV